MCQKINVAATAEILPAKVKSHTMHHSPLSITPHPPVKIGAAGRLNFRAELIWWRLLMDCVRVDDVSRKTFPPACPQKRNLLMLPSLPRYATTGLDQMGSRKL
jgi:hypothetical protein